MAYAVLSTGTGRKGMKITHQQAIDILDVLEGRKEPEDAKQEAFAAKVHKVYFNWREADPLYIMQNIESITPFALAEWSVDATGRPVKPATPHAWDFARRYRLWEHGGPVGHAKNQIDKYQLRTKGYK